MRVADGGASRLLGHHQQQAAQLPPARAHAAEEHWPSGHRGARQCAVRGRRRRDGAPPPAAECDVHTLLRLPTGIFYAQGVKANALFFDRKPASETPWTKDLWIYDLRTNCRFTLKNNPLTRADLDDFVACYNPANRLLREETERFRSFTYDKLAKRDKANLDIFWLRDESMEDTANLPPPDVIADEIREDHRAALEQLEEIAGDFSGEPV